MRTVASILSLVVLATSGVVGQEKQWPEVRESELTVGFSASADRFELLMPIYDGRGSPIYWLICKGGGETYLDRVFKKTGVNYVGPLLCRLDTQREEREYSLLGHDDSPIWHTRGQFHFSELIGACGEYPEYGRVRHFRLRGFELTLTVEDPIVREDGIEYFRFEVMVERDPTAHSPVAEPPSYLDPAATSVPPQPRSCDRVIEK